MHRTRALEGGFSISDGLEKSDVRSGDKGAARADEHDRACGGILRAAFHGCLDGFGHSGAERVHRRIVDSNDGHLIADFVADEFWHGSNLTVGRGIWGGVQWGRRL